MNNKSRMIVALAFVLTLGAGTMLGVGVTRMGRPPHDRSWLADELNLTPQQREQMKEIGRRWVSPAGGDRRRDRGRDRPRDGHHGGGDDADGPAAKSAERGRDDAIAALIPANKKAAYDKIIADYNAARAAQNRERSKAFQDAVERTKKILDDKQRVKYEEILKRREEHRRGPRGGGGMPSGNDPR